MKWVFVYNADSGVLNAAFDFAHKIISPDTYECNLCMLTYGSFTEKKVWKKFRKEAKGDYEFLHKDQFEHKYRKQFDYPIILEEIDDGFKVVLTSDEMDAIDDVEALIEILNGKVAEVG